MTEVRGFTLIEILVAFAIAAMALVTVMQVFGTGLKVLTRVERQTETVRILRSQLAHLSAVRLDDGTYTNAVGEGGLIETKVQPLQLLDAPSLGQAPLELTLVEIKLKMGEVIGPSITLRNVLLRPTN